MDKLVDRLKEAGINEFEACALAHNLDEALRTEIAISIAEFHASAKGRRSGFLSAVAKIFSATGEVRSGASSSFGAPPRGGAPRIAIRSHSSRRRPPNL